MDDGSKLRNAILKPMIGLGAGLLLAGAAIALTPPVFGSQTLQSPIDLVLVIDNSGSMKTNDPQFLTRQVIKDFVTQLPAQSRVGMVLFDENVQLLHRLRIISNSRVQQQFLSSLEKIDYNGLYTNSPGGIERALYELKTNGRTESRKAIVFLTDGIVTTNNKSKNMELTQWLKRDLTRELKHLGIRIYGVAFTEAADFSLIQTLAARTEGEYFRAKDASQLTQAFKLINDHLNPEPTQLPAIEPLPILPTANGDSTTGLPETASAIETSVVVVAPNPWMLYLWLTLITIVLAGAVILFFTKYQRPQTAAVSKALPLIRPPQVQLQDLDGACRGDTTTFTIDTAITTIGRGEANNMSIPQATISKHHAIIEFKNAAFYVMDLKSTNGTRVNGLSLQAHEPMRLKNGDRISFGKFHFQVDMPEQMAPNDTVMLSRTSLNDPEDQATIMIDLDRSSDQEALITCLQHHLMQIEAMGPKFKTFVRNHFSPDTLKALAAEGDQNLHKSQSDHQLHCATLALNKIFYLICSLPVETLGADNWYGATCGGFTQFVRQWINSEPYQSSQCNVLCIATFGKIPTHWVSLTIIPTHNEPDPVEIISVDFLNPEEKSALSLEIDPDGRVL